VEDLDEVQGLAAAAFLHHDACGGGFFPIMTTKLAGRGRRSLHPASRCTTEVAYPCFGM
jgi:hypothetical protein